MSWLTWFDGAMAAIEDLRGEGVIATGGALKGRRLPRTSPIDSIAILTQVVPGVIAAVTRGSSDGQAYPSGIVGADGVIDTGKLLDDVRAPITAKAYVGGYGDPAAPYKRATTGTIFAGRVIQFGRTYEPALAGEFLGGEETNLLAALREAMRAWQQAVDASAALVFLGGADLAKPFADAETFWRAVRQVCVAVDVLDENPPQDRFDRIKEAVGSATKDTANQVASAAGELAAGAANLAGETAGSFFDAFIANGSILAFLVAGIVVYKIA